MRVVEIEFRANQLSRMLASAFGFQTNPQSWLVSRGAMPETDVPDVPTWTPRDGERCYLYRGTPNGRKVELAVTELALERFGVREILRALTMSNAIVALEGHRTLVYVDDGLLRYRPVAAVL